MRCRRRAAAFAAAAPRSPRAARPCAAAPRPRSRRRDFRPCAPSVRQARCSAFSSLCRSGLALALDHLKTLEFGMAEIEAFASLVVGAGMGTAEFVRTRPGFECRLVDPGGVRRIQRVVVGNRSLEQVELDEARHLAE